MPLRVLGSTLTMGHNKGGVLGTGQSLLPPAHLSTVRGKSSFPAEHGCTAFSVHTECCPESIVLHTTEAYSHSGKFCVYET